MSSRDERIPVDSGDIAWDAALETDHQILFERPLPIAELLNTLDETDLETAFPANTHRNSLIWVYTTALQWVLYYSDGVTWATWASTFSVLSTSGVTVTSTSSPVTLTSSSTPIHYITPGANINVTANNTTETAGRQFTIVNQSATFNLVFKDSAAAIIYTILPGQFASFNWTGSAWVYRAAAKTESGQFSTKIRVNGTGGDYIELDSSMNTITLFDNGVEGVSIGVAANSITFTKQGVFNERIVRVAPVTPASQAANLNLYRAGFVEWNIGNVVGNNLEIARDGVVKLGMDATDFYFGGTDLGGYWNFFNNGTAINSPFQLQVTGTINGGAIMNINGGTTVGNAAPMLFSLSCTGVGQAVCQQNGNGTAGFAGTVLGTGDALFTANINGGQAWSFGLDNSDSDRGKISASGTLGTNDILDMDTTQDGLHRVYGNIFRITPATPASQPAELSLFRSGFTDWRIQNDTGGVLNFINDTVTAASFVLGEFKFRHNNAQASAIRHLSELTTIAASPFTDTSIQVPAGAVVVAVSTRVTVQPGGTSTYDVGVSGATTRYTTGASTAATTTDRGTADGWRPYAAATAVRITPNTTPSDAAGRIRVTIHYIEITPPTS